MGRIILAKLKGDQTFSELWWRNEILELRFCFLLYFCSILSD